jgi:His-Xaa-Ser system radical SAM maturase HxsC
MGIQLRARGVAQGVPGRVLGQVTRTPVDESLRSNYLRVVERGASPPEPLVGYAAVLFEGSHPSQVNGASVHGYPSLEFLRDGYVVAVDTGNGFTHVLYRPESQHNVIFATDRCNSNCLMCSQPPKDVDDSERVAEHLRLIDLIPNQPVTLGITGGEPTLLKDGLVEIIARLKERFPQTPVTMLSNGRLYVYEDYVEKLVAVGHPRFLTSIPLYANNAIDHDYVVQAAGAFDQTVRGLYNAAKHKLAVEIRVVLHKQTIPGLRDLMEFIYRNLPFVQHVALMGLEPMGYVKKNWDLLWMDPVDYAQVLEVAVRLLYHRRVNVSLYNLPRCVLPKPLWSFARQSISDFKNIYIDECNACRVRQRCCGLFQSAETRHSRAIRAVV